MPRNLKIYGALVSITQCNRSFQGYIKPVRWICISYSRYFMVGRDNMNGVCVLSHVWLFVTLRSVAHHAPLSMEFSRQEYWSMLSFPTPGDLPDPGIKLMRLASPILEGGFFIIVPPGKPTWMVTCVKLKREPSYCDWTGFPDWRFSNLVMWIRFIYG